MKRSFRRNLRAVSPVIATIIIVAIAIVMSIAVAYWMLGLGAAFTRFEKLEITSGYAVKLADLNATHSTFELRLILKNTGSATATIDELFFNGIPSVDAGVNITTIAGETLEPGDKEGPYLIQYVGKSGMTLEVMIRTVAGRDYPKVIVLP